MCASVTGMCDCDSVSPKRCAGVTDPVGVECPWAVVCLLMIKHMCWGWVWLGATTCLSVCLHASMTRCPQAAGELCVTSVCDSVLTGDLWLGVLLLG